MDRFYRIKENNIYPPFLKKARVMLEVLERCGESFIATQGERSFAYQAKLYSYGRTDKSRGIITKARPGWSAHNYAVAIDFVYDRDSDKKGLQPSWSKKHYRKLADAAICVGLEPGYYWKNFTDGPHIQLPLRSNGISISKLRRIYRKAEKRGLSGKESVFDFLDKFEW